MQELGAEVIVNGATNKATINNGSALEEVCLPVKVCFGHVCELYKQVDYLFAPRLVSVAAGQYTCPKIIGMPDMIRSNLTSLPPIIDVNVNLRSNSRSVYQAVVSVGRMLGQNAAYSLYAWYRAWRSRCRAPAGCQTGDIGQNVGLIGHPYILQDRLISMDIMTRLKRVGLGVVTPEMVSQRHANAAAASLGKKIFWSGGSHLAGTALALLRSVPPVNGLIFISSFSCGPDTLIGELICQRAQSVNIPCMLLTVDEHTAEAGFVTRLEAFADMLLRRKYPC